MPGIAAERVVSSFIRRGGFDLLFTSDGFIDLGKFFKVDQFVEDDWHG